MAPICAFEEEENVNLEAKSTKFIHESRVRTREDEKTKREREDPTTPGGLLEVDDKSQ